MKNPILHFAIITSLFFFNITFAFAQEDEVTNFDDLLEESTDSDSNVPVSSNPTSSTEDVTVLEGLAVETDEEAAQNAQAKRMESVNRIDASELQNTSKTISKAVNTSSGVKIRQAGGIGSEAKINIRGMEGKNIKVLVNGVPVETNGNLGLDDIPIDQIENIEVYKGYIPARFATDGMGGAINVITKKRPTNSIDASYSLSSYNTHKASLSASHLFEDLIGDSDLEIGASGYYNHSDNDYEFTSPYMKNSKGEDTSVVRDHDKYNSYNAQIFANLSNLWFDQISLGASFSGTDHEYQFDEYRILHTRTEGKSYGVNFGISKKDFFFKDLDFSNNFSASYAENRVIDTSHIHCRNWVSCDTLKIPVGELTMLGLPKLRTSEIWSFNDLLNLEYEFYKDQRIYSNTLFKFSKEDPEDDYGSKIMGFNTAGFPNKVFSITSGLSLEDKFFNSKVQNLIGFKFHYLKSEITEAATNVITEPEETDNDYTNFSYDESLILQFIEPLAVKASYQHAVRLPTSEELFGNGVDVSVATDLKPEQADNINFGISLDLKTLPLITRLRLDADVFYAYIDGRIHYQSSSQVALPYYNMNPLIGKGFEWDLKIDPVEYISLGTNMTFQDIRNKDYVQRTGIPKNAIAPNIPRFFMNYMAEFHIGDILASADFLRLWWNANYTDEYYYAWRSKASTRNKKLIPSTFTQDIGIEYSICDNRLGWSFEIDNFMDAEAYDKYGESKPGRTFATKIRYSFH